MKLRISLLSAIIMTLILSGCGEKTDHTALIESARSMATIGSDSAKITLTEFSDYQCPYCARFHEKTFSEIKQNFVDTGMVKFEFRDFPLPMHGYAQQASLAAYCSGDQGKYWEMNALLFQNSENLLLKDIKRYANDLGLESDTFNTCLSNKKYLPVIQANKKQGIGGVNGKGHFSVSATPSFWINYDWQLAGAQPYEVFEQKIQQYIEQQK
jgi:protein-disulfide isomerase